MKKISLCIAAALFGLAHVSFVVAEGTQQLSAEQSARPLSAFCVWIQPRPLPLYLFQRGILLIRMVI